MSKVIDHPERLDVHCTACGKLVTPRMKKRFKVRDGMRVRVSPCCEAATERDNTRAKGVRLAKKILADQSGAGEDTLRDMRVHSVPLHLLSKKDLIRTLHVVTEKMLRSKPTYKSVRDVLIMVGMAGTAFPNGREFAAGCTLERICPKVKAAREGE